MTASSREARPARRRSVGVRPSGRCGSARCRGSWLGTVTRRLRPRAGGSEMAGDIWSLREFCIGIHFQPPRKLGQRRISLAKLSRCSALRVACGDFEISARIRDRARAQTIPNAIEAVGGAEALKLREQGVACDDTDSVPADSTTASISRRRGSTCSANATRMAASLSSEYWRCVSRSRASCSARRTVGSAARTSSAFMRACIALRSDSAARSSNDWSESGSRLQHHCSPQHRILFNVHKHRAKVRKPK
jgi:hypothetical protein